MHRRSRRLARRCWVSSVLSVEEQLNDEASLVLAENRLDCSHDPRPAADLDPVTDLQGVGVVESASGNNHVAAP
jgi:hypothetical protein